MRVSDAASRILEATEAEGLLLVHDQALPSATALIAGAPVLGSWWSHPLANVIYGALGSLEDRLAQCKLVNRKVTLVAPRLWAVLASVGSSRDRWQLNGLPAAAAWLLAGVDSAPSPVILDSAETRAAGRQLEERLLVSATEIHTYSGRHVKVLATWESWMKERGVKRPLPPATTAMTRFEAIVDGWEAKRRLLPWPRATGNR